MILWGTVVLAVSIAVWLVLRTTSNPVWNFIWFSVLVLGWAAGRLLHQSRSTSGGKWAESDRGVTECWYFVGKTGDLGRVLHIFRPRWSRRVKAFIQGAVQRCQGYTVLHLLQTCQDLCVVQGTAAGKYASQLLKASCASYAKGLAQHALRRSVHENTAFRG